MSIGTRIPRRQPLSTFLPGFAQHAPKRNVLVLLGYAYVVLLVAALVF